MENGLVADAAIASSERELHALWALRDDVLQTARYGMPFAFDISLPIADMEAYVHTVQKSLSARWPDSHCWVFGHMGDGNLHVVVHTGNSADRSAVEKMVYDPLVAIGGSVSAEHGIGLEKKKYLPLSRDPAEIALMHTLKQALDPQNMLNPGKIID